MNKTRKFYTFSLSEILIAILSIGLLGAIAAKGQTPTDPIDGLFKGFQNSGLLSATNYSVAPYLTYAPQAPKGAKIGGGFFTAYNFNNFVGAGMGVDYLGKFSLVSANISLKYPIKLFTATNGWLSTVYLTPFTIDGVGKGISGTDSSAVVVTDAGASLSLFKLWGGTTDLGYAYGRWDNAGVYSGPRQHVFLLWHKNF